MSLQSLSTKQREEILAIHHGNGREIDNYESSPDNSDFDEYYYSLKPPPLIINPDDVINVGVDNNYGPFEDVKHKIKRTRKKVKEKYSKMDNEHKSTKDTTAKANSFQEKNLLNLMEEKYSNFSDDKKKIDLHKIEIVSHQPEKEFDEICPRICLRDGSGGIADDVRDIDNENREKHVNYFVKVKEIGENGNLKVENLKSGKQQEMENLDINSLQDFPFLGHKGSNKERVNSNFSQCGKELTQSQSQEIESEEFAIYSIVVRDKQREKLNSVVKQKEIITVVKDSQNRISSNCNNFKVEIVPEGISAVKEMDKFDKFLLQLTEDKGYKKETVNCNFSKTKSKKDLTDFKQIGNKELVERHNFVRDNDCSQVQIRINSTSKLDKKINVNLSEQLSKSSKKESNFSKNNSRKYLTESQVIASEEFANSNDKEIAKPKKSIKQKEMLSGSDDYVKKTQIGIHPTINNPLNKKSKSDFKSSITTTQKTNKPKETKEKHYPNYLLDSDVKLLQPLIFESFEPPDAKTSSNSVEKAFLSWSLFTDEDYYYQNYWFIKLFVIVIKTVRRIFKLNIERKRQFSRSRKVTYFLRKRQEEEYFKYLNHKYYTSSHYRNNNNKR